MPMRRKVVRRRARLLLLVRFAAAGAFEAAAVWLALSSDLAWNRTTLAAAVCHLAAAGVFLPGGRGRRAMPGLAWLYPRLAALLTFFLPPLGLPGFFLALASARGILASRGLAEEMAPDAPEALARVPTDLPDARSFLYEELNIEPLVDILCGSDPELKRGAVNLLRAIGSPEAVRLLKKTLSDPLAEVRFYAHTALTRLEEEFAQNIRRLSDRLIEDDPERQAALGLAHLGYAESGLPEEGIRMHSLRLARDCLFKALKLTPGDKPVLLALGRACLLLDDRTAARMCFERTLKLDRTSLKGNLGLCRMDFEDGNFDGLAARCRAMADLPPPESGDPYEILLFGFWAAQGKAQ